MLQLLGQAELEGKLQKMVTRCESAEVTVEQYASVWLKRLSPELRPKTVRSYHQLYRLHIAPTLGALKIRELRRAKVKQLLTEKRNLGLSRNTIRLIRACLSVMCSEAVDDELIKENPASALGLQGSRRETRLTPARRPLSEAELVQFLTATERFYPDYYALFLTLARTGCRPGEARALRWPDIDFEGREILIERAFSCEQLGPTKTGGIRRVDMSQELTSVLRQLCDRSLRERVGRGWGEMQKWVFINRAGKPIDEGRPGKVFAKIMVRSGLECHTVYDLRHTFATLHLAKGHPITYVSSQLGHSSPTTTLRWYAHWLPTTDKRYADSLDTGAA